MMRARSWVWVAVAAVVVLLCALGVWIARDPGPPQATPLPQAIVALGDSTVSGEGAGVYVDGSDGEHSWCHRAATAEVLHVDVPEVAHRVNFACSGARASDLLTAGQEGDRSQVQRLGALASQYRINTVLIGVGANDDPNFAGLIQRCIGAWLQSAPPCSVGFDDSWKGEIDAMSSKVEAALRGVRAQLRAVGYHDQDYQLVVQSYAAPLGPDLRPELQNLGGCPLSSTDLQWVRSPGVEMLSAGLRRAADAVDARFLDLSRAGRGHEACTGIDEWFTRLTVQWQDLHDENRSGHAVSSSFHPNPRGHSAIAGCMSAFLATSQRAAACVASGPDSLEPVPAPLDSLPHG